jgi:hemerythrin-like domain-containing protein
MMPIGSLMIEHRLIERVIAVLEKGLHKMNRNEYLDPEIVATSVEFIRIYADRCHHGKEEDILFRDLERKQLSDQHRDTMNQLKEEHVLGRQITNSLSEANDRYYRHERGSYLDMKKHIEHLVEFYPAHIETEDKRFFVPCMEYFDQQEQDRMLQEFWEFDRSLIHDRYRDMVESLERETVD